MGASFAPVCFRRELDAHSRYSIERTALQTEIREWLCEDDTRSFMVLAPTGTGKSALAAQLVQTLPDTVAFHFCVSGRRSTLAPRACIRSLAAQLATKLDDYAEALANTIKPHQWIDSKIYLAGDVSDSIIAGVIIEKLIANGPLDEFETLLQAPLDRIKDRASARVIVVDGLDEAATIGEPNIPSLLRYLEDLPPWLRFVWTSQPDRRVLRHVDERRTRVRRLSNAENQSDLRRYIQKRCSGESAFAAAVAEKADGNFQYAKVLFDAIDAGSASASDIPALPKALPDIYGRLLRRISSDSWSGAVFRIASALAAAFEPLSAEQLSWFSGVAVDEVMMHLGVFGQFLEDDPGADGVTTYRIFHQSLRDYFFDHGTNRDHWISTVEAHARISTYYAAMQGEAWKACDEYGLRYLPTHLSYAGRDAELRRLLLDFSYLQSKLEATDLNALIADYDYFSGDNKLRVIQEAMRLSSNVIARDPREFASQLVGRLQAHLETPEMRDFVEGVTRVTPRPWLRPINPALHPPETGLIRTLEGHQSFVQVVALTQDEQRAVSGSYDGKLLVWDVETGHRLKALRGHGATVRAIALLPDDRVITASLDRMLKIWELNGEHVCELLTLPHDDWVTCVALAPDRLRAVSGSCDKWVKVWNLQDGRELLRLRNADYVSAVEVTADGRNVLSASSNKLIIWDLESGRELRKLESDDAQRIKAIAVTADGRAVIALDGGDGMLQSVEIATGRGLLSMRHGSNIRAFAMVPNGLHCVSASRDTLKVWDLENGDELQSIDLGYHCPTALYVTEDGCRAISCSMDHKVKLWDLENGGELVTLRGHTGTVNAVALSRDGLRAVSASDDQKLKVWDLSIRPGLLNLRENYNSLVAVTVTPDGRHAVSIFADGVMKVWKPGSDRELLTKRGIVAASMTPDGKRIVYGTVDGTICVWDVESGHEILTLRELKSLHALALMPDGQSFVSIDSSRITIWKIDAGRRYSLKRGYFTSPPIVRELQTKYGVSSRLMAIDPHGSRIIFTSENDLKVWEFERGRELRAFVGHESSVQALVLTPDGRRVVSASYDGTLKVWDLESGQNETTFHGHATHVTAVAVTSDGRRAVSASADGAVKVWELDAGAIIAAFSCDASVSCCAFINESTIFAGDKGGGVYTLALEQ